MFDIISSSIGNATELLDALGYFGVFILSLLDRLTIFLIPAEIVLPAFGILVSQGKLMFWPVFFWLTFGNFIGNLVLYFIFLKGGRPFIDKYGKYFLITKHDLDHLDSWFSKYGERLVLFGYLIPAAIRSLVPIPAGIAGMKPQKFMLYTFLGSLPLNLLYLIVGIKAGDNLQKILVYVDKFNYLVLAVIIIFVIWYVYRHVKRKHLTHE